MLRKILVECLIITTIFTCVARAQVEDSGYVQIHADPRLSLILHKPESNDKVFTGRRKGFRVQIYNGNDRKKASQVKVDFMRLYPGIRSYLVYNNPHFRVRVGDFVSREAAAELQAKLSSLFAASMIVPDIINVSNPKK